MSPSQARRKICDMQALCSERQPSFLHSTIYDVGIGRKPQVLNKTSSYTQRPAAASQPTALASLFHCMLQHLLRQVLVIVQVVVER